ncbi:hypothetical protein [Eudoraea sp.]|uniref:hypothetical protein n=1 Tax=Eudoraea sp. TaxID=1979955 RepID=UPI003C77A232
MNKKKIYIGTLLMSAIFMVSCKNEKKETKIEEEVIVEEPVVEIVEVDYLVVDEHHFDDVPMTSHGKNIIEGNVEASEPAPDNVKAHTSAELHEELIINEYVPIEIKVTEAIIPLEETQTIVAYNKKDEQVGVLQVVTDENGDISKIAFADRNHKDKYDVKNGMTAKEAKQLRRRLKHVQKKSNHYLYDDQSNIMYLLDIQDSEGDEITEAVIDQSEVRAIIWEDKSKSSK